MRNRKLNLNQILSRKLIVLLAAQIVSVVCFGSFGVWTARERQEKAVEYILKMYQQSLDTVLSTLENDLEDILSRQQLLELLQHRSELQRWHACYSLAEVLRDKRISSRDVDGYIIADSAHRNFLMNRSENITYGELKALEDYMLQEAESGKTNSGWISARLAGESYLLRYYNYRGVIIAGLVSSEKIVEILSLGNQDEISVDFFVTDAEGTVLCSSDTKAYGEKLYDEKAVVWSEPIQNGSYYIEGILKKSLENAQTPYFFVILALMCAALVMLMTLQRFMGREVVTPIRELEYTSRRIQEGDYSCRPEFICSNREMTELKETYELMLNTILEMKVREYERVIQMKDSEIKYMHMQLKPHFFLNALSTVNSMAYEGKMNEIHEFIQVFSENIRYMFKAGLRLVSLEEEIENVGKYLKLQRMFYKESFYSYMDVPDELRGYPVPQMLVHTFVENIFKHVISVGGFTTIFVVCSAEEYQGEKMLKIEVQNSGREFSDEILKEINEGTEADQRDVSSGIGLKNVKEILNLMYEREGLLKLENLDGGKVTVWIPRKAIEKNTGVRNHESADRG